MSGKIQKALIPLFGGILLLPVLAQNGAAQAYDPGDWYGDRSRYFDDYDDVNDYFYDDYVYDPNDYLYEDDFYDDSYDSLYFRDGRLDARWWDEPYRRGGGYTAFGNASPHYPGIDRYYGPHTLYDGRRGLYEQPYGFNNYYYDDNDFRSNYFTDDWYDDAGAFDEWY